MLLVDDIQFNSKKYLKFDNSGSFHIRQDWQLQTHTVFVFICKNKSANDYFVS